jgi:hypothetical protein
MKLILLTGYARAGKSSLLDALEKKGILRVSSSRQLSVDTLEYFDLPTTDSFIKKLEDKEKDFNEYFIDQYGFSCREAKIHVAENVIVPRVGRLAGLIAPAIDNQLGANIEDDSVIAAEVFNSEEWFLWKRAFRTIHAAMHPSNKFAVYPIQVRRKTELANVDGRELIGAELWNDGTITEAVVKVFDYIK